MRPLAALTCVLPLILIARAARAEPTALAWSTVVDTAIPDLTASDDGRWVAFVASGSGNVRFLDTWAWEVVGDTAACAGGTVGGVAMSGSDGDYRVFAGCSDGTVVGLKLDDTGQTVDLWKEPVALAEAGAVLAVETDGSDVYAIAEQSEGNDRVHRIDLATGTEATTGYPTTFGQTGFTDSWLGQTYLFVSHGGQKVSKVEIGSGSISSSTENLAGRELGDMYAVSDAAAFLADAKGGVIRYNPGGNDFDILLDDEDGLESNQALAIDEAEGWLAVYDAGPGEVVVFEFSGLACGDVEQARFETADISEMVVAGGYLVGGGEGGALQVLTDRPWVEISGISPATAVSGDEVVVSFTVSEDADWGLYLGGNADDPGTLLADGTAEAEAATEASFTVDGSFAEGDNDLWVLAGESSRRGHDLARVDVDNPPARVDLGADNVGFGNQQITVSFDGIDDEDLDHYVIFCTVTEFLSEDWPSGGPEFDGTDEVEEGLPRTVTATAGEPVLVTIQPLTNDVTYHVAVRAYDQGGQESEMSNVVAATPRETIGAAAIAGEQGGYCGTSCRFGVVALGLGGLLALGRRRAPAALLLVLAAAPAAQAAADDETARERANVELRFGPYFPSSQAMRDVYGEEGRGLLQLEGGAKLGRFIEVDLGAGFYQDLGTLVSVDDHEPSAEHCMITAWPFAGALGVRADIFKNQILVPTGEIGLDYWLWRENWYSNENSAGEDSIAGGELGWHWGFGVNLLLDGMDQRHASTLKTSTGIDDTYLVVDWRTQRLGQWGEDGTSLFDGTLVTIGLKIDM